MPPIEIKDDDGNVIGTAIVCTRNQKPRCKDCGRESTLLCDYPVTTNKSGTCDRKCCRNHAVRVGENKDYCLPHARHSSKR